MGALTIPVDDILRHVDLVGLISRRVKLKPRGKAWWGLCPFHKEGTPSFKVENARRRYKCFACDASGDAIDWLRETEGLDFLAAIAVLRGDTQIIKPRELVQQEARESDEEKRNAKAAARLWAKGLPARGTLVETYLRSRGIKTPVSPELRFLQSCIYSETGENFPAMIARLSDDGGFACVQRTYLKPDGSGKAPVPQPKRTLGAMGASAVRLRPAPIDGILGLAEGIETALSAAQLYSLPVWATLSCSRLSSVAVPANVGQVTIFADGGPDARNAAFAAAEKIEQRGIVADVMLPSAHFGTGHSDFNDALRASA